MIKSTVRSFVRRLQPLTHASSKRYSPLSDLFIWRNDGSWKTHFTLLNYDKVLGEGSDNYLTSRALFIYFSPSGQEIKRVFHNVPAQMSSLISVSADLAECPETFGTFCVIHSRNPNIFSEIGCRLTERGYAGYTFKDSEILSYIHGNLDAVSMRPDGKIKMLGGTSILQRSFNLQYLFQGCRSSSIFLTNPSRIPLEMAINFKDPKNQERAKSTIRCYVEPRGCFMAPISINHPDSSLIIEIRSRLCMARPIVFWHCDYNFNVFHG